MLTKHVEHKLTKKTRSVDVSGDEKTRVALKKIDISSLVFNLREFLI